MKLEEAKELALNLMKQRGKTYESHWQYFQDTYCRCDKLYEKPLVWGKIVKLVRREGINNV